MSVKIAFVSHKFQTNDGQGRINYELVKAVLDHGYDVTILASVCAEELANHPRARYISMGSESLPTALLRGLWFAWVSARWLRQHRQEFNIIQANGFVTWEDCDIVAAHFVHTSWLHNKYYPFKALVPYQMYQRLVTTLNSRWEKRAFFNARAVIAVSKRIREELEVLGVRADRIRIVTNGVDTVEFHPGAQERELFGLPPEAPLSLFVGDIRTPRKNLETVLQALKIVPALYLVVAGALGGSPYPDMARSLGIEDRVIFLGKVKQMGALMRSVDLFVFPSRYEPFGMVVLEAMASGLPVIVSGEAGINDYIGEAGYVLRDPNDVNTLAEYLSLLLSDKPRRLMISQAGRERALEMQMSQMTAGYLQVYEAFLEREV